MALYVKECYDYLELSDGGDRVECLWVRIRGKANKESVTDHPARIKRQMKYSISGWEKSHDR